LVFIKAFGTFRGIFYSFTRKTILVPLLDYEEEEDDEDEPHVAAVDKSTSEEPSTFLSESPTPRTKAKPVVAAGPFHHRLATPKDVDTHAKVSEALRRVDGPGAAATKNPEAESRDSDEEEEEEQEDSEEEEEEMEEEEEEKTDRELAKRLKEGEEDVDEGEEEVSLRWKSDLATKARDAFYTRQSGTANLRKLVYGQQQVNTDIN
jgi:hypothetical protein